MKNTKWIGLTAIMIGSFMASGVAFAATYNFYFNNTEQGDNSTATPNVTVEQDDKGGAAKVTKTGGDVGPNPMASAVPAVMEEKVTTPVVAPAQPVEEEPRASIETTRPLLFGNDGPFRHFSMGLGIALMDRKDGSSSAPYSSDPNDPFGNNFGYSSSSDSNTGGLMLNLGYDFTQDIGVKVFALAYDDGSYGSYSGNSGTKWDEGVDLELTPIHVKAGRHEHFLDFGGMIGADDAGVVHVFGGPRMNLNISSAFQLTASYRFSPDYNMLEMGVALRI